MRVVSAQTAAVCRAGVCANSSWCCQVCYTAGVQAGLAAADICREYAVRNLTYLPPFFSVGLSHAPAGCAVWCSALASTMRARLLPGEGSAVFMATRLWRCRTLLLLTLVLLPVLAWVFVLALVAAGEAATPACWPAAAWALSCASTSCAEGCPAGVLGAVVAAAAGEMAGKSAACTRPHAPWPNSLQRLLVAARTAAVLNCTPTWHSAGTGGMSAGMLCCWAAAGAWAVAGSWGLSNQAASRAWQQQSARGLGCAATRLAVG